MRQPLPYKAIRADMGERMLCILANTFYIFGDRDELDAEEIRDRLQNDAFYRQTGDLMPALFLLREGDFQLHAIGRTNIIARLGNWFGAAAVSWFTTCLKEQPRYPVVKDVETFLHEGWVVMAVMVERYSFGRIMPVSPVLIAGQEHPVVYNPATGEITPFDSSNFAKQWEIHLGIVAARPRQ
ncbi:MAG TPA: hypothetical protein VFT59_03535 [Candidatus Saccharimonadales bacterium]|nr:hypothetical protein [Candidatus Saccharimonadales bacterium]